jgi:hypothetical protein
LVANNAHSYQLLAFRAQTGMARSPVKFSQGPAAALRVTPLRRGFQLLQFGRSGGEFRCIVSATSGAAEKFNARGAIAGCPAQKNR